MLKKINQLAPKVPKKNFLLDQRGQNTIQFVPKALKKETVCAEGAEENFEFCAEGQQAICFSLNISTQSFVRQLCSKVLTPGIDNIYIEAIHLL